MQNIKFKDKFGDSFTTYKGQGEAKEFALKELAILREIEPERGWKVQTQGELVGWHDWDEVNRGVK